VLRKLALLLAFVVPVPLLANICPVSNADPAQTQGIGDGCTTNPSDGLPDFSFIFPTVGIFKSTFTPACNNHDKCYSTLGADYGSCDSQFRSDMRSRCSSQFPPLLRPVEYSTCMHTADLYYAGVSAYRSEHPESAVFLQHEALNRSRIMGANINDEWCGTTPERTTIYTTALINQVRSAFQSYAGRPPSVYEFMEVMNWGDSVHNYLDDRAGWQANLYTRASQSAGVPLPSVGWYLTNVGDYGHTFAVTPVISGASYRWKIPNGGSNPTLTLSYFPPMFNRKITYAGFVRVQVGSVRNLALVETSITLPGTCAPNNGPWVNCQ